MLLFCSKKIYDLSQQIFVQNKQFVSIEFEIM